MVVTLSNYYGPPIKQATAGGSVASGLSRTAHKIKHKGDQVDLHFKIRYGVEIQVIHLAVPPYGVLAIRERIEDVYEGYYEIDFATAKVQGRDKIASYQGRKRGSKKRGCLGVIVLLVTLGLLFAFS